MHVKNNNKADRYYILKVQDCLIHKETFYRNLRQSYPIDCYYTYIYMNQKKSLLNF